MADFQNNSFWSFWDGPAPQTLSKLLPSPPLAPLKKNRLHLLHQLFLEAARIANNKNDFEPPFAASFGLKHKNCTLPLAKIYVRILKGQKDQAQQTAPLRSMYALGNRLNWIFTFHQQFALYYLETAEENRLLFDKESRRWRSVLRQKNWNVLVDYYDKLTPLPKAPETPKINAFNGRLFSIERQRSVHELKRLSMQSAEGLPLPQPFKNLSLKIAEEELAAKKSLAVCEGLSAFLKDLSLFFGEGPLLRNGKGAGKRGKVIPLFRHAAP